MLLRLLYDSMLAQASYLVGCPRTGQALVVDANRDAGQYVAAAEAEGLAITHVTETHIHADFVSGSRELARRTGATLYLSDEGDASWKYGYAAEAGAVLLKDGGSFQVGSVRLDAVHTPGHTPEHLAFLVTDTSATSAPMGLLTGDFVFVGDVGRPDLLERTANVRGTMEASARQLYRSLGRLRGYADHLQIWPAHGAGSACGKSLGAVPQSTLGYERMTNWAFQARDESEFVAAVLAGQPDPPHYFAEMKRINRDGPPVLGALPRPGSVDVARVARLLAGGAPVIDVRPAPDFAAAHLPGSLNIPLNRSFAMWAGWLLPYDRELYLVADATGDAQDAVRHLTMIGLDRVAGLAELDAEALAEWRARGGALASTPQLTAEELAEGLRRRTVSVVDVRWRDEWEADHVPGVPNMPLGYLAERLSEVPPSGTVVVHCQTGSRSAIAASLLEARGWTNVANLAGGFAAWRQAGLPTEGAGRAEPVAAE